MKFISLLLTIYFCCISSLIEYTVDMETVSNLSFHQEGGTVLEVKYRASNNHLKDAEAICLAYRQPGRHQQRCKQQLALSMHSQKVFDVSRGQSLSDLSSSLLLAASWAMEWASFAFTTLEQAHREENGMRVCLVGKYSEAVMRILMNSHKVSSLVVAFIQDGENSHETPQGNSWRVHPEEGLPPLQVRTVQFVPFPVWMRMQQGIDLSSACSLLYVRHVSDELLESILARVLWGIQGVSAVHRPSVLLMVEEEVPVELSGLDSCPADCSRHRMRSLVCDCQMHSSISANIADPWSWSSYFSDDLHWLFPSPSCHDHSVGSIEIQWKGSSVVPRKGTLVMDHDCDGFSTFNYLIQDIDAMLEVRVGSATLFVSTDVSRPRPVHGTRVLDPTCGDYLLSEWRLRQWGDVCRYDEVSGADRLAWFAGSRLKHSPQCFSTRATGVDHRTALSTLGWSDSVKYKVVPFKRLHVVITFSSRLFQDNAEAFRDKISSLSGRLLTIHGDPVEVSASISSHSPLSDPSISDSGTDSQAMVMQLALGCHFPSLLLVNYLCLQTEQPFSYVFQWSSFSAVAYRVMRGALAVLSMSPWQEQQLRHAGLTSVFTVPFYCKPFPFTGGGHRAITSWCTSRVDSSDHSNSAFHSLQRQWCQQAHTEEHRVDSPLLSLASGLGVGRCGEERDSRSGNSTMRRCPTVRSVELESSPSEEVDVMFYGACTSLRLQYLQAIQEYAAGWNMQVDFLCVKSWKEAVFDAALHRRLLSAKLIICIPSYPLSSLPVHRLMHLLQLGKCSLCERSDIDSELDQQYSDACVMVHGVEDMVNVIDELLHDDTKLRACRAVSAAKFSQVNSDLTQLQLALQTSLWTAQNRMYSSSNLN